MGKFREEKEKSMEGTIASKFNVGEILRFREKMGLTQAEMERVLGLGVKVVTRWERGEENPLPPVRMLVRIFDKYPWLLQEVMKEMENVK